MKTKHSKLMRTFLLGASLSAALSAYGDYPSSVAALGPVAYYRLGTTNAVPAELSATNSGSLGTALNGTYVAMASSRGLPGALIGDPDTAVSINASTGQKIVVPYSAAYNPNGPFSVECWVKADPNDTATGKEAVLISMVNGQNAANGNDRSGWSVQKLGDVWEFVLGYDHSDGATFYATTIDTPSGSVTPGTWQHLVAVYTPTTASLYLNGVLAGSATPTFPLLPNRLAPLLMGNRGYGGWNYYGDLDEVAVYTTALSATDILAHYNAGLAKAGSPSYASLVQADNPALYFRLDEPSLDFPVAANSGSWGAAANGSYELGSTPGIAGLESPAANAFGAVNPAVALDGTNGFVQIPAQMEAPAEATFVAWVKRSGVQTGFSGIVFQRGSDSTPTDVSTGLSFNGSGTGLSYTWNNDPTSYNFDPGLTIPDQTWTFVAGSVAADHAVLYVGTAAGLTAATNTAAESAHDFSVAPIDLGWDSTSATRIVKGDLDEVAIFDKALDYTAVSGLFKAALPAILGVSRTPADPIYEGLTVTATASVAAAATPVYQWYKGGSPVAGQTGATLTIAGAHPADSGAYSLVATVSGVSLTSAPVQVTIVSSAPVITQSPASLVRDLNGLADFTVAAVGTQPITYQWSHAGTVIPGATNATLVVPDLQAADAGAYSVLLSNPLGTNGATATLTLASEAAFGKTAIDGAPLGYWPLSETAGSTAFDLWGGRDGVVDPAVTLGAPALAPPSYQGFAAGNAGYTLAGGGAVTVPALNLNNNTMTIVTWIQPAGAQPDFAGLVFSRTANTVSGLDYNTGGQIGYHWNNAADTYGFTSGLYPATNVWNFVALVVEPTQATLYLDAGAGMQTAVNTATHSPSPFEGALKFGLDDNGGGRNYTGGMGPVVIYNRSLSAAEIGALRTAGIGGQYAGPAGVAVVGSPASQTVMVGDSVVLQGMVAGSPPISFQWTKNGTNVPGAIRSSLTFPSAGLGDSGSYVLKASQTGAVASSSPAVLTVNPAPEYLNATNGLVVHLKFDGDYSDSSGRGNSGTPQGAPSIVPGVIGSGALRYSTDAGNSVYNYVTLGTPADLNFGNTVNFSVAYWIKFTGLPGDLPFFGNAANSTYNTGLVFSDSYKLGGWFYTLDDGNYTIVGQGPNDSINDGVWHSLVHTFDWAGSAVTYLDGVLVSSIPMTGLGSLDTGNVFNIGQDPSGAYGESAVESMDDFGVWRRALTRYEAESIYLVGSKYGRSFDVPAPAVVVLTIAPGTGGLVLGYTSGTLQSGPSITGPWTAVAGASAPSYTVAPGAGNLFYRVLSN